MEKIDWGTVIKGGKDTDKGMNRKGGMFIIRSRWKIYARSYNGEASKCCFKKVLYRASNWNGKICTNEEVSLWPLYSILHLCFPVCWYWDNIRGGIIPSYQKKIENYKKSWNPVPVPKHCLWFSYIRSEDY